MESTRNRFSIAAYEHGWGHVSRSAGSFYGLRAALANSQQEIRVLHPMTARSWVLPQPPEHAGQPDIQTRPSPSNAVTSALGAPQQRTQWRCARTPEPRKPRHHQQRREPLGFCWLAARWQKTSISQLPVSFVIHWLLYSLTQSAPYELPENLACCPPSTSPNVIVMWRPSHTHRHTILSLSLPP